MQCSKINIDESLHLSKSPKIINIGLKLTALADESSSLHLAAFISNPSRIVENGPILGGGGRL